MKKLFATFLALVMVLSSLCLPAVAAEGDHTTATTWDDLETTTVDGDTYRLIYNEAEFKLMARDLTANYRLANDITFAKETYAQTDTDNGNSSFFGAGVFKGILDGNGHTLDFTKAAFTYKKGGTVLFKDVTGGTIKNLTVKTGEITISHTGGCQQAVVAYRAQAGATFENVHVEASFKMSGAGKAFSNLGALIGKVAGEGKVDIKNCTANVTTTNVVSRVGAFVGCVGANNAVVTIQDSTASGSIQANTDVACPAGGFVGQVNAATAQLNIANCVNNATVDSKIAGGILGDTSKGTLVFTNCVNLGSITGATEAGGIMGQRASAAGSDGVTCTFDGCVNVGAVESEAHRAAGISPHFAGVEAQGDIINFYDCINFGAISNTTDAQTVAASETPQIYAADAIYCWYKEGTTVNMKNCVNFGTRSGYQAVVNGEETTYEKTTTPAMYETAPTTETGSIDFTVANASTTAVLDSALLAMGEEGKAQIRLSNDKADAGIRFAVDTNSAVLAALTTAGYTYKLGSLIATDANIGEGALTKDALGNKKYSAKTEGVQVNDDRYMVAVNDIEEAYYAEAVRCAGIIELTKDGTTYTIYTEASLAKSLADVAQAALDDQDTEAQAKYAPYKTTLEDFAAVLNSAE